MYLLLVDKVTLMLQMLKEAFKNIIHIQKRIFMKNVQKCNQKPEEEIKY